MTSRREVPTIHEKLKQDVGRTALVVFEQIKIHCKIVDSAFQYGVERYKVEPLDGQGSQWVNKSRITFSK